jgi:hypothetical protein
MRRTLCAAAALLGLWAFSAAAQQVKKTTKVVPPKDGKTIIDFTAITIDGKLKRPLGSFIMERRDRTFDKLLDINESFLEQIVKAADEY